MTALTHEPATDGQIKQIARVAEDAAGKAVRDYENFSKDRYADEEVSSSCTYPPEYTGPKPLAEQVARLKELFPELVDATYDASIATSTLPEGAEGWFAIPRWQVLAKSYGEAVEGKVFAAMKATRPFHNYREDELGPKHLRESEKKANTFRTLAEQQKGHDILVVPAQFGIRHAGRSVRRVREVMPEREFGLGAFEVGVILLAHSERLVCWEQLHLDCVGDECASYAVGGFWHAPFFFWFVGGVKFNAGGVQDPLGYFGSASGFLPQS